MLAFLRVNFGYSTTARLYCDYTEHEGLTLIYKELQ
ncbi:MAG: hypothetical protein ACI9VT_000487 [Psychroserpens sp.]|jgi:hypothetical protein